MEQKGDCRGLAEDYERSTLPRRKECHESNKASTTGAVWTVARCNRLLRPLVSRLAVLRSAQQRHASRELGSRKRASEEDQQGFLRQNSNYVLGSPYNADERPRKRLKKTYSSRAARRGGNIPSDPQHEESLEQAKTGAAEHKVIDCRENQRLCLLDARERLVHLLLHSDNATIEYEKAQSRFWKIPMCNQRIFNQLVEKTLPYSLPLFGQGLYDAIDNIFKSTCAMQSATKGSKSLLDMCLRQLPRYIAEEQHQAKREDPDTKLDMSSVIYDVLESLGGSPDQDSWAHLRDLTRAHGAQLLCDAVVDRTIPPTMAREVVILLLQHRAYDEAESLTEAMLRTMSTDESDMPDQLFSDRGPVALSTLHLVAAISGRNGFKFGQLAAMFESGVLPIDCVASREFKDSWSTAILSVNQGNSDAPQAGRLLKAIFNSAAGVPAGTTQEIHRIRLKHQRKGVPSKFKDQKHAWALHKFRVQELAEPTETTLTDILTVLTATTILRKPETFIVEDLAIQAYEAIEICQNLPDVILLAAALPLACVRVGLHDWSQSPLRSGLFQELESGSNFNAKAGAFVCNVARCCGKASFQNPYTHIKTLAEGLCSFPANALNVNSRTSYKEVALGAAFMFAEATGERKYLNWAVNLEREHGNSALLPRSCSALHTPGRTPFVYRVSKKNESGWEGYRWEEGISEWVAKTPGNTSKAIEQASLKASREADNFQARGTTSDSQAPTAKSTCAQGLDNPSDMSPCPAKDGWKKFKIFTETDSTVMDPESVTTTLQGKFDEDGDAHKPESGHAGMAIDLWSVSPNSVADSRARHLRETQGRTPSESSASKPLVPQPHKSVDDAWLVQRVETRSEPRAECNTRAATVGREMGPARKDTVGWGVDESEDELS